MNKSNTVFVVSVLLTVAICAWGIASPDTFGTAATGSMNFLTDNFSWFFTLTMTLFVVFCLWIGFFSEYKNVRLGPDDSRPEYSDMSWFAMLFSAGMGVGLVFWGVAEPLNYFTAPIGGLEAGTPAAMRFAFAKSFLHWGIHPWANYTVLALALAYMQFRKNRPALVSSAFAPFLGDRCNESGIGKTIDILALVATLGGVGGTSLGLGVLQINSGLNFIAGVPETKTVQVALIVGLAVIYILTAVSGVDKGIKFVCDWNVRISFILMLLLLVVGPTVTIFNNMVEGVGAYLSDIVYSTFANGAFGDAGWYKGWTVFYWAWWIAWAPFTGSFIARISKGRTIGEFVRGVVLLPCGFSVAWFAIFGTLGMDLGLDVAKDAVKNTSLALFTVLQHYPLGTAVSIVIFVLICTFFVTSANSATFVLGMYSENGNPQPTNRSKVIWGALMAGIALAMLLASDNGLGMIQTMSIVAAFPFAIVMFVSMAALVKALSDDKKNKQIG